MQALAALFQLLKYTLIACFLYFLKIVYEFIYRPWRIRQRYKKYKNVIMNKEFYPMLGDLHLIDKNVKENKSAFSHYYTEVLEHENCDLRIVQFGADTNMNVISVRAFEEFERHVPKHIDRFNQKDLPNANLTPGSLVCTKTDEIWKQRRKEVAAAIGIKECSKYIPMMIKA